MKRTLTKGSHTINLVGNLIHRVFALARSHPFSEMLQMAMPPSHDSVMHWLWNIFQFVVKDHQFCGHAIPPAVGHGGSRPDDGAAAGGRRHY